MHTLAFRRVASVGFGALLAVAIVGALLVPGTAQARNLLTADGPGGTYDLIRTAYTIEVPDCGHMVEHISEEMDPDLNKPVFLFHAHVAQDDDRCGAQDRQRTEIRGRAANIVANNGETVYYRWKFKLDAAFKGTGSFTHIFQIKSDQAAPVMTLTPRTSTMAIDGRIGARGATPLAKFLGHWVVVDLSITFGNSGKLSMVIKKLSDGEMLFNYSGDADMWDDNASAHDPKWGIYRSLNDRGNLRDERVRFADFCVSKTSATECADGNSPPPSPPPAADAGAAPDASRPRDAAAEPQPGTPDAGTRPDASDPVTPPPGPPVDAAPSPPSSPPVDARPQTPRPDAGAASPTTPPAEGASGCGCRVGAASADATGPVMLVLLLGSALGWRRLRRRR